MSWFAYRQCLSNQPITNPLAIDTIPAWMVKAAMGIFLLICAALYVQIPVNPDSAVFDYIGWVMSQGGTIYVDAADQNWPGQMLIHFLGATLFGNHLWSYRALEVLLILPLSSWILFSFLKLTDNRLAAFIVIPVFWFLYITSGYWLAGQRDLVAGPLLIAAVLMLYRRVDGQGAWWLLVAEGAFIAFATLIRPTLLITGPLLMLVDVCLIKQTQRSLLKVLADHILVGFSILAVFGLVALLAMPSGALAAWFEISIRFPLEVYSHSKTAIEILVGIAPYCLQEWGWFLPLMITGGYWLHRQNPLALWLVLVILPVGLISIFVQGKGLGYHLAVWYSSTAILIAVAIARILMWLKKPQLTLVNIVAIVFLLGSGLIGTAIKARQTFAAPLAKSLGLINKESFYSRYAAGERTTVNDIVALADYARSTTNDGDTVLVWGRPCHINTLSGRRSPFFAISSAMFMEPTPEFSGFLRWKQKFQHAFEERPPALIMLFREPSGVGYQGLSATDSERLAEVLRKALVDYRFETTFGNVDIYRHQNHSL